MRAIDVLTAIKARRSVHSFKSETVPEGVLKEIFTYGSWAPTHYMKEPWKIKLYQSEGKITYVDAVIASYQRLGMLELAETEQAIKTIQYMKDFLNQIPHHALIYFSRNEDSVRYEEDYAAVCAFIQNAQLAAWKYNVGMLWTITPYMHEAEFSKAIGIDPNQQKIAAVMQIGYPKKVLPAKSRIPIEERLEFVSE